MNRRNVPVVALGIAVAAGLALMLVGIAGFTGQTRDAFVYPGSGTSALALVLLVESVRSKRNAVSGQEDNDREYCCTWQVARQHAAQNGERTDGGAY